MNTKQLIALWYTGLAIASILIFSNGEIPYLLTRIVCASIIGFLSVLTFRNGNQLDKMSFLRWVLPVITIPIIVVVFLITMDYVKTKTLPSSEMAKVQIERNPKHYDDGDIFADIYNGSSYQLSEVVVLITAREKVIDPFAEGNKSSELIKLWSRQYKDKVGISPLTTGIFHVRATDTKDVRLEFEIVEVRGRM